MNGFFKYRVTACESSNLHKYRPIRIIQLVLCMTSLVLLIVIMTTHEQSEWFSKPYVWTTLIFTAGSFTLITWTDCCAHCLRHPMNWTPWAIFSAAAIIFFIAETAFSLFLLLQLDRINIVMVLVVIFTSLTCVTFIADLIYLFRLLHRRKRVCCPGNLVETPVQCPSTGDLRWNDPFCEANICMVKPVNVERREQKESGDATESSPVSGPPDGSFREWDQSIRKTKRSSTGTTSYGGTFHMSKDSPPLPSPAIVAPQRKRNSTSSQTTTPRLRQDYCSLVSNYSALYRSKSADCSGSSKQLHFEDITPVPHKSSGVNYVSLVHEKELQENEDEDDAQEDIMHRSSAYLAPISESAREDTHQQNPPPFNSEKETDAASMYASRTPQSSPRQYVFPRYLPESERPVFETFESLCYCGLPFSSHDTPPEKLLKNETSSQNSPRRYNGLDDQDAL